MDYYTLDVHIGLVKSVCICITSMHKWISLHYTLLPWQPNIDGGDNNANGDVDAGLDFYVSILGAHCAPKFYT